MERDNEEEIRKKKDKKRSRYFNILVNGKKVAILNYRIKNFKDSEEEGQVIELISQFKLEKVNYGESFLQIETDEEHLEITGRWKYGPHGPGNYQSAYFIDTLIRIEKPEK